MPDRSDRDVAPREFIIAHPLPGSAIDPQCSVRPLLVCSAEVQDTLLGFEDIHEEAMVLAPE